MKIKILNLLSIFLIYAAQCFSQSSIDNLTKYWWYRYRLVNDFMKIGEQCGESIPASQRHNSNWDIYTPDGNYSTQNHLDWGDATTWLGQYLAVLVLEYKLLASTTT